MFGEWPAGLRRVGSRMGGVTAGEMGESPTSTDDVGRVTRAIVVALTREVEQLGEERAALTAGNRGPQSIRAPFYHMNGDAQVAGCAVETVYPAICRRLRSLLGVTEEDFVGDWQLDGSVTARKGSGKSGSLFASSVSKRFMLKTIPRTEKQVPMCWMCPFVMPRQ